jgi:hypothetical protein
MAKTTTAQGLFEFQHQHFLSMKSCYHTRAMLGIDPHQFSGTDPGTILAPEAVMVYGEQTERDESDVP